MKRVLKALHERGIRQWGLVFLLSIKKQLPEDVGVVFCIQAVF
ncbi:hypothetical protein [Nostoc sp. UHCC 0251]|nr:hypothetical protein [Nostoc sp. UHCC 0251]MEA5624460.1 hypothetical protein [Nostoc sp. UHCC 0251]